MTTFLPPYMGEEVKSNAERKIFDTLQDLDLKNAYVLHSLGLPRHQTKIYGEIDFVVVCESGIACLEIKGGRVECREGIWYFIDRYNVERAKPEGPFAQVTGNMFSLKKILRDKFPDKPHIKNMLVGCGVMFPDIAFRSDSQEIICDIIYDRTTVDITEYMERVFTYWEGRQHKESSKLSPSDIKEIVNYLRGEFTFIPTLADRLDGVENRLIRLTSDQFQVMDALSVNDHLLIEGNAGTGKTLLAMDFARKKAAQGMQVLYLTYNKNLSNYIVRVSGDIPNLKVINIHALFGECVPIQMEAMRKDPQKYFSEILPAKFYAYVTALDEDERKRMQYDLLVMDEGQDIIKPDYLYSLDCLLRSGFERGHWAVFYDEKQNIYNPEYRDGMDLLSSYSCTKFHLFVNCRNTVQIGTYSSKASGVESRDFIRENGEEVQKIVYAGPEDYGKKIREILKNLRAEKVDMRDVTFLSPKKYRNSRLGEAGIKVAEVSDTMDESLNLPRFATIQGFKGLDSKIVILTDVDHIYEASYSTFIYIAATRARTLLYVVGSEDFWEKHKI